MEENNGPIQKGIGESNSQKETSKLVDNLQTDEQKDLDELLSDDENDGIGENKQQTAYQFLMQIPPDFEKAAKHGVNITLMIILQKATQVYNKIDVKMNENTPNQPVEYCQCCNNLIPPVSNLFNN